MKLIITSLLWREPRRRVALTLFAVWLAASWPYGERNFLWLPLMSVMVAVSTEFLWHYVWRKQAILSPSATVTGFLIGLLLYPTTSWYFFVILPAVAILLKLVVRLRHRTLFNPAGLALLLGTLLWNTNVTWWGTAWSPWLGLFVLVTLADVLWRLKLWPSILSFTIFYTLYLAYHSNFVQVLPLVFDGTFLLFTAVMFTEPKSGPQGMTWLYQVSFAALVAGGIYFLSLAPSIMLDSLLTALLVANLIIGLTRWLINRKSISSTSVVTDAVGG